MEIGGFIKNSFIDYPGVISSVIFTNGCNFECWFCHNKSLLNQIKKSKIDENEVLNYLEKNKTMIEGVVITGGEPTLQKDLEDFITKIKSIGLLVKLDTNGTNPAVLKRLLDNKLLDFVAMDIKTTFEKYSKMVKREIGVDNIKKSISLILEKAPDHEFRTTFTPDITVEDISKMASYIAGAKAYAIQKFRPNPEDIVVIPHIFSDFEKAKSNACIFVDNTFIRGF